MTLSIEGDANDYFGKGLSGGKHHRLPARGRTFKAEDNIIIGNVASTAPPPASSTSAACRRRALRRPQLRRHAVVEGVGDHGCEYMTGGRVVVLGPGPQLRRRHVRRRRLRAR
jgi:glutamate synthase domain-containing protein 3